MWRDGVMLWIMLYCALHIMQQVDGNATFLLHLEYYQNPSNRLSQLESSQCCQGLKTNCTQPCQPIVNVCIMSSTGGCISDFTTPVITEQSTAQLGALINNMSNPIKLEVPEWKANYYILMAIYDKQAGRSPLIFTQNFNYISSAPGSSEIYTQWNPRVLQSKYFTLIIQYKFFCSDGFYGPHCNVSCNGNPQTCGKYCKQDQAVCGHGTCMNTIGSYICTSSNGFTGKNCEFDVDECTNNHLCNTGTCVNNEGGFFSMCLNGYIGWKGGNCDVDINECETRKDFCNTGNCINTDGGFFCDCSSYTTGTLCEIDIDECLSSPCKNNGTCLNYKGNYACICPENTTGIRCDSLDSCTAIPCHHGKCDVTSYSPSCICEHGYTGTYCETDINECIDSQTCENGGTCINFQGGFNCACNDGYAEIHCENITYKSTSEFTTYSVANHPTYETSTPEVTSSSVKSDSRLNIMTSLPTTSGVPCNGHGKPYHISGLLICLCFSGWTGNSCETDLNECINDPCDNNSTCENKPGDFHCHCPRNWEGKLCDTDVDECLYHPCENKGQCNNTLGGFLCYCRPGWSGKYCQIRIDACATNPCLHNGTCIDKQGIAVCSCEHGWTGEKCENDINECFSDDVCKNNATCLNLDGTFYCNCSIFWEGASCDVDIDECQSHVCPNNLKCVNDINGYNCVDCQNYNCSNGGVCMNTIFGPACNCSEDWVGEKCEKVNFCKGSPCGLLSTCISKDAGFECHLHPCLSSPCQNNGSCSENGASYQCQCEIGWTGKYCENVDYCASSPCLNNGSCHNSNQTFNCQCPLGWLGNNCDIQDYCYPDPCIHDGNCTHVNGTFDCICDPNWTGNTCDMQNFCVSDPCENNGTCSNNVTDFVCACDGAWYGKNCTKYDHCYENPCINGGSCINQQNDFSCACVIGTTGKRCEQIINWCDSNPCLHNGTCISISPGYYCRCNLGYIGRRCQNDIDECSWSSCPSGSDCHNLPGGFECRWRNQPIHRLSNRLRLQKRHAIQTTSSPSAVNKSLLVDYSSKIKIRSLVKGTDIVNLVNIVNEILMNSNLCSRSIDVHVDPVDLKIETLKEESTFEFYLRCGDDLVPKDLADAHIKQALSESG